MTAAASSARSGTGGPADPTRWRPARPARLLASGLLLVGSLVAALSVYTRLSDRMRVLVLARDVPAGARLAADDLTVLGVAADAGLAFVPASSAGNVVGSYARVRLAAGSLLVTGATQLRPLVDAGRAVVTVSVAAVPSGVREDARVLLVLSPADPTGPVAVVDARVVSPPSDTPDGGVEALAVSVPLGDVATVVLASRVGVAVVDPAEPLASTGATS